LFKISVNYAERSLPEVKATIRFDGRLVVPGIRVHNAGKRKGDYGSRATRQRMRGEFVPVSNGGTSIRMKLRVMMVSSVTHHTWRRAATLSGNPSLADAYTRYSSSY
jgi:orotidine-5'-phosphate decarboxylase